MKACKEIFRIGRNEVRHNSKKCSGWILPNLHLPPKLLALEQFRNDIENILLRIYIADREDIQLVKSTSGPRFALKRAIDAPNHISNSQLLVTKGGR